jgi:hypothetical protein
MVDLSNEIRWISEANLRIVARNLTAERGYLDVFSQQP